MKRVFVIVLDSCGAGAMPDAADYGDAGVGTIKRISKSKCFSDVNMKKLGLGNIPGLGFLGKTPVPEAAYGRMAELSRGKDTTIGHWEMSGVVSSEPLPTYPDGFPKEIIKEFSRQTGRGVLCNLPYSGTEVIKDYGEQHLKTGDLIVYTSADSVFQIAAHEELVPPEQLYEYCRIARRILTRKHSVGRVIARPFVGKPDDFTRTVNRHDFSLEPYGTTMLDRLKESGRDVIAVGKITDIFAGRGVTETILTHSNAEGMEKTLELAERDFHGLCFVNLVDMDMKFGHRQDVDGYAGSFAEFDGWLPEFLKKLGNDDALIITADHGCDPGDDSTDHTREYVPLLVWGRKIVPVPLGTRKCFADVAQSVCEWLDTDFSDAPGKSFASEVTADKLYGKLVEKAKAAMQLAYAPYSRHKVGAALLGASGKVYCGCNIENAAYSPTNCAERTAFFKAVCEGERSFICIAVVGGKDGVVSDIFTPCGVCRQVMMEFCDPDRFVVIMGSEDGYVAEQLSSLLKYGFGPGNLQ